jgi:D-galactarolactone cycloisomerase
MAFDTAEPPHSAQQREGEKTKIDRVRTFVVKIPYHDRFGGQTATPNLLAGGEYYFEAEWNEVYADRTQTLLIRIDTDDGLHGWGEAQAPIVPEAAQAVVDRLLAPMLIGADPREVRSLRDRCYLSMNGRGHFTGFMVDAIAGCDIALWDIAARAAGVPLSTALGVRLRDRLPAYVSGVRAPTTDARAVLTAALCQMGYEGVKLYLGRGVEADLAEAEAARGQAGPAARLFADLFWVYPFQEAVRLGRGLEGLGIEWLESPLPPEDLDGHARLVAELALAVAAGETLRTRFQFAEWLARGALDVAQPDIARCGVTEGERIAALAADSGRPVALHLGVSLGVAMAATWQVAATLPNFFIQEHHPPMLELSNRFLTDPLQVERGSLLVPASPGIGVDVDLDALAPYVTGRGDLHRIGP